MEKVKTLERYTRTGMPYYANEKGERLCCLEGCYSRSWSHPLCGKHAQDENDYSGYLTSIKKSLNTYKLINNSYYEVNVSNSDLIYKIDIDDYNFAKEYTWNSDRAVTGYPYLIAKTKVNEEWTHIKFHIKVMEKEINQYMKETGYQKRIIVDHKNGEVTDNRKSNLRIRTQSENNMNKGIQSNNNTGVVGVTWTKKARMWTSRISINNEDIELGSYYYFRNAVKARIEAENKYFGEHALKERENSEYKEYIKQILNLPPKPEPYVIKVRNNTYPTGVSFLKNKNKFRGRIERNRKVEYQLFDTLEEAIKWRKQKEIEYYGENILYSTDKLERQI